MEEAKIILKIIGRILLGLSLISIECVVANAEERILIKEVEAVIVEVADHRAPPALGIEVTNRRDFPTGPVALKIACQSYYGFGLVSVVYVAMRPAVLQMREKRKIFLEAPETAKPETCSVDVAGWFDPRVDGDALLQ